MSHACNLAAAVALTVVPVSASVAADARTGDLVTAHFFVPHVSTVPAIAGQVAGLYVRQKVAGTATGKPVVLFVHGATVPSVPDFDLEYKDYNWMAYLANAGFNTYAMDLTGYGGSPKPMMDDPCNVDPKQQHEIVPRPLKAACAANYPHQLTTIRTDWDEMDAVVEYLRKANGVQKVHLVGWSAGGPRVGGYAALHPDKVERIVLYAPSPTIPDLKVPDRPGPGFPMSVQTRADLEKKRWDPDVRCAGQLEPGIRDVVWKAIMQWDRVGATWGPEGGLMRGRVPTRFGWPPELAAKVTAPALVMVGEFDRLDERRKVFEQISSQDKVFLDIACGSHFMLWESPHAYLHAASLQWLKSGEIQGVRRGSFRVDAQGRYAPSK